MSDKSRNEVERVVMCEAQFRQVWRILCRVWRENRHCLERGCGRETLEYWARKTCHVLYPPFIYRQALLIGVNRGWAKKGVSACGYSTFVLYT